MNDSAEAIAKVINDVADNRFNHLMKLPQDTYDLVNSDQWKQGIKESVVVDATLIYNQLRMSNKNEALYQGCLMPVWTKAVIGFINEFGNAKVVIYQVVARDDWNEYTTWEGTDEPIEWDRVICVYEATGWVGGRSNRANRVIPTAGPALSFSIAVYEDGTIADIHYILTSETKAEDWEVTILTFVRTIDFANSTNVVLIEPHRPRHVQRRLLQAGIKVRTVHILPGGKTRRNATDHGIPGTTPLTSVRGHWAKYGIDGRGLLFGKIAGRFWIPQHARGDSRAGEIQHHYETRPDKTG